MCNKFQSPVYMVLLLYGNKMLEETLDMMRKISKLTSEVGTYSADYYPQC